MFGGLKQVFLVEDTSFSAIKISFNQYAFKMKSIPQSTCNVREKPPTMFSRNFADVKITNQPIAEQIY